jgi:chromosome segregation ATPase
MYVKTYKYDNDVFTYMAKVQLPLVEENTRSDLGMLKIKRKKKSIDATIRSLLDNVSELEYLREKVDYLWSEVKRTEDSMRCYLDQSLKAQTKIHEMEKILAKKDDEIGELKIYINDLKEKISEMKEC